MWRDIVMMNRARLLEALDQFTGRLDQFRSVLEKNDPDAIADLFRKAKTLRDEWTGRCASSSPE
jgi:prephenate dehydrogenase